MTLRGGLQQLSDALVAQLPQESLRAGCSALAVHRHADRYRIDLSDGSCLLAEDVVFATPSFVTADLVGQLDPVLAERLRAVRYVSTATVSLGFRRSEVAHPLQGAGFIVPPSEGRRITACSWSSAKFQHRAPQDCVLLRVFIGGALAEELAEQDEDALVQTGARGAASDSGDCSDAGVGQGLSLAEGQSAVRPRTRRAGRGDRTDIEQISRPASGRRCLSWARNSRLHPEWTEGGSGDCDKTFHR